MAAAARSLQATSQGEVHSIEMAGMRVSTRLTDNLVAYGLGACVAVCIYDPSMKVAGIAYVVAPEQQPFAKGATAEIAGASPGKFADTAIPMLVQKIDKAGGQRTDLRCAVIGGGQIFGSLTTSEGLKSGLEIGERTVAAVRVALKKQSVKLCALEVGGCYGRTVLFRVCDGAVLVKQIGGDSKLLSMLSRATEEVAV